MTERSNYDLWLRVVIVATTGGLCIWFVTDLCRRDASEAAAPVTQQELIEQHDLPQDAYDVQFLPAASTSWDWVAFRVRIHDREHRFLQRRYTSTRTHVIEISAGQELPHDARPAVGADRQ